MEFELIICKKKFKIDRLTFKIGDKLYCNTHPQYNFKCVYNMYKLRIGSITFEQYNVYFESIPKRRNRIINEL